MPRIVGGRAGGRRLEVPAGGTRPTTDRVREALFSTLESALGPLRGLRVLDLYAGSGAVGLEAASRGAADVVLVESSRPAVAAIRRNIASLEITGAVVQAAPVRRIVAAGSAVGFDLVYLDPPYETAAEEVDGVLSELVAGGLLADGAVVVVERDRHAEPPSWPAPLVAWSHRQYGETVLWYGRAAGG
jgi:16S rRNA (guanine966-N2)-methyltransferase